MFNKHRFWFFVAVPSILALAIWGFFLANSWRGVDFGWHWDENVTQISIRETVESGILLPTMFLYPGMCYDLELLALLPEAHRQITGGESPWTAAPDSNASGTAKPTAERSRFDRLQENLRAYVDEHGFLMTARSIFAFVSSLLVLWLFVGGWATTDSAWGGLLSAAIAGLSWEFLYHSRWAVPDALTASFAAMSLAMCALILRYPKRQLWCFLASVAAGFCASSKYPGAIAMFSVTLAIFVAAKFSGKSLVRQLTVAWLWFFAAFLVTSPGTVLNPLRFFDGLQYNKNVYSIGHLGHTIESGWQHVQAILSYMTCSISSESMWLSLMVAVLALVGVVILLRKRPFGLWLLVPFALYVLYMGAHRVFFVRNSLLLFPYLILLATAGMAALWRTERTKFVLRPLLVLLLGGYAVANAISVSHSTDSIEHRVELRPKRLSSLLDWSSSHSQSLYLSPRLQAELHERQLNFPSSVRTSPDSADVSAFYLSEVNSFWPRWESFHRTLFLAEFGTQEVNTDYYPWWGGEDRIVVLNRESMRHFGITRIGSSLGPWPLFER
ncbi:MAG: hypothetical protein H6505_02290 [Calditrichaeota bacterium]|nr:hypothetical protein [Calditrichota bacterium]